MRRLVLTTACVLGSLPPAASSARTLNWEELAVEAQLDADGRLHIRERQVMVFDGAWNGGERQFRLRADQEIILHGITKIDPATGQSIELQKGSLTFVDRYDWTDRKTVRWRSRMPSDPEFDNETIVYVLDYTLSGVVERKWDAYVLDHDFAFPDRYGVIERLTLEFDIDPAWGPRGELAARYEAINLPPGLGYVVTAKLDYAGSGKPSAVFEALPLGLRMALVLAALATVVVLFLRFRRSERDLGRYDPTDVPVEPGRDWLEAHLLNLRPEVVGALWDRMISAPEVSALLARLVAEEKLASRVEKVSGKWKKDVLHLELLVDRQEFEGYERQLVDKLFFDDRTETSTEAVREHYKSRGFSPSATINSKLRKRMKQVAGFDTKEAAPSKRRGLILLGIVLALVGLEALTRGRLVASLLLTLAVATFIPSILGYIGAHWRRLKADDLMKPTLLMLIPLGFILGGLWSPVALGQLLLPAPVKLSWAGLAALLVFGVAVANSFFNNARTRDGEETVRNRKRLAGIREYFKRELEKPVPSLEDGWFPYLLAFGLAKDVDRWSVAHGQSAALASSGSGSFSGSSAGRGWTGGGGSFGGAGASAGWAAAATGIAAGVASPSSGGGGGGGGGGGSSGGGGGGGW